MPEHLNVVYKLEGDVGEIDVFKLAPTLLALGGLIQESNRIINPQGPEIAVNVKPFREGSFIVDLTVFVNPGLQRLVSLFTPHSLEEVKTLLEIVGMVGGTGAGAIAVIKKLRSKPEKIEEIQPGEYRYTAKDNQTITVSAPVHQLLSNSTIVTNIYKVYGTPMEELPEVQDVKTYIEGDENNQTVIERDDVPILKEYGTAAGLTPGTDVRNSETIHESIYLNPKRGSFDGDPRDWSFRRGDEVITATVKDKDFLERCIKGEYRLNYSDLLIVDLLERQRVVGTEVLKPTYEIVKVKEYVAGSHQLPLELNE